MTNLDSIPKSRDVTLPTKVCLVKAMVFPVFMYGCESWIIKKAEHWSIDAFELWYWRRLLRVPWTARRSNQSILKKLSPGCSLEGLILKLKLQHFGYKEYDQSDFSTDHLVMSMYTIFSCVVGRGCSLWPVHSLGKTLLAFALLHSLL